MKVTSLEEIKNQNTEIIELSPFAGEQPVNVRVRKLSILGLCSKGVIPNPLLGAARQLFYKDRVAEIDLKQYGDVIDIICNNTLVEPSVDQLNSIGVSLTDEQKFELYSYSQGGVEALKRFRAITKGDSSNTDSAELQSETE